MPVEFRRGKVVYERDGELWFTFEQFCDALADQRALREFCYAVELPPKQVAKIEREFLRFGLQHGYKLIEGDGDEGPYCRKRRVLKHRLRMKELIRRYRAGESMKRCKDAVGCKDKATLLAWLRASGCERRYGNDWFRRRDPNEIERRMREMWGKLSTREMAKELGVNISYVNRQALVYGLREVSRPPTEAELRAIEMMKSGEYLYRQITEETGLDYPTLSRLKGRMTRCEANDRTEDQSFEEEAAGEQDELSGQVDVT